MKILLLHDLESINIIKYIIESMDVKYRVLNPPKYSPTKYSYLNKLLSLGILLYLIIYTKIYNPKIVITFIDNYGLFETLSRAFIKIKFYSIQNGNRTKRELIPDYGYGSKRMRNAPNFFCFGDYEEMMFNKFGHKAKRFIPVGSLRHSFYLANNNNTKIMNDICFVSMWRDVCFSPNSKMIEHEANNMKSVDKYMQQYISATGKSLSIALRLGSNKEYNYYRELYGSSAKIVLREETSTYQLMDESELIISSHSTCCAEAFGIGKKVLWVDYSKDKRYSFYKEGLWLLTENTYTAFKDRLNILLNMNQSEYNNKTKKYADFVMKYDINQPTYLKIQNELKNSLLTN